MTLDWPTLLRQATDEFAATLVAGDLVAAVPSCPGWTVADLGNHLRTVHLWAAHAVREGNPDGSSEPVALIELADAYRRAAEQLLDVLESAGPHAPAWTFATDRTVAFWWRRQTHETTLHLYDALLAQGRESAWDIQPDLAHDGLLEVATMFYPRQVRLGRTEALPGRLVLTAIDVEQTISIGDGDPVALTGTAADLLLTIWKRIPAADPEVAMLLATTALTP